MSEDLTREWGIRTAGLHALLDVRGDAATTVAALRRARGELNALIKKVSAETKKNHNKKKVT